jgi:hypothetical protein
MEAKALPHLLIKKKRITQLINGKLDKNRYKPTTNNTESSDYKTTHKHSEPTTTTN